MVLTTVKTHVHISLKQFTLHTLRGIYKIGKNSKNTKIFDLIPEIASHIRNDEGFAH